jgi:protein-tyrosine-phosphatase
VSETDPGTDPTGDAPLSTEPERVLFVCRHGAAKSVIAAAAVNRLAAARGLRMRAEAAGLEPDEAISPAALRALGPDAAAVAGAVPRAVTAAEVVEADRVIALGVAPGELPAGARTIESWDDLPAVDDAPEAAREAIERRVHELLAVRGRGT